MGKIEFNIYSSEIYYTYCSFLDVDKIDFKILIKNIFQYHLSKCVVSDSKVYYSVNGQEKVLGFNFYFEDDNKAAVDFYPIRNSSVGDDIPPYCLNAVSESLNHNRLFNKVDFVKNIKIYLDDIYVEVENELTCLTPIVTLFEDGVIIVKYRNLISDVELNLNEFIEKEVNLSLYSFNKIYVNPFLCKFFATSYNHSLQIPFYRRWGMLKDEKIHYKEVDKRTTYLEIEDEIIPVIALVRDEFAKDTLSSLTQSFLNVFAFLLSKPAQGVSYLFLGQKKIIKNGNYWEGRPYVYLIDFKGNHYRASDNNKNFKNDFLQILERSSSKFRKKCGDINDVRFFDDSSVFFEKSVCLKVLARNSHDIDIYKNYILSHEAIATYIEYVYMIHRALLQKITQSHSVNDVSILRWKLNQLSSPHEIAASGEVRLYAKEAWEKFGINTLKEQISEAIIISYDDKKFLHEKNTNLTNLVFAILFGLLAIPSVGKEVIAPIWKAKDFYYPTNSYEPLYFFFVTAVILLIVIILVVLLMTKILSKKV